MGPDGIVMTAPALDDNLRLAESVEDLAVEQLVPEPGIKALDIAILPVYPPGEGRGESKGRDVNRRVQAA